jgi:GNAT superfamily N-acetyltransferase
MLKFREIEKTEYQRIFQRSDLQDYIEDLSVYEDELFKETGKTSREFAEAQFTELLSSGTEIETSSFWTAIDDEGNEEIGHMWIIAHAKLRYSILAQIKVVERYRNRGYGTRMLEEWEDCVRKNHPEYSGLLLHVFKHNPDARRLYERFGFKVNDESFHGWNMIKSLER